MMAVLPTTRAQLLDAEGAVVNLPTTSPSGGASKATPLFNPNILPAGYMLWTTGAFDDLATGKRGRGAELIVEATGPDTLAVLDGQFFEHIYIHSGEMSALAPALRDWGGMLVYAPASAPTEAPGGDGNANKVATGLGFNVIIPAPLGDGAWNVDGATLQVGEINAGLVPVPNASGAGYWDWDPDASPSITPVENPATPDGSYDLFDAALPLVMQGNKVHTAHQSKPCCPDVLKAKKVLPHWVIRFLFHRHEAGEAGASFMLRCSRKTTTNGDELLVFV